MITKSAQIDLWKSYKAPIEIVQYEGDGRVLNFILTSGGSAIDLTASMVVFYAKKPSGAIIYNSCSITDAEAGKVSYTITTQTCIEAGTLNCFIEITTATPTVLRLQNFEITVKESEDVSEAAESTSEFTALTEAIALTTGFDARITQNESDISDNADAIDTKVDGAGAVTADNLVQFSGTGGKTIKGGLAVTTTVANPGADTNIPTEQAVREAITASCAGDVTGPESSITGTVAVFGGETGKEIVEATDATGLPVGDAGGYFPTKNAEAALQIIGALIAKLSYRSIGGAL
jgi:hypothetical protein